MIVGVATWRGVGATTTAMSIAAHLAADGAAPWLIEADPAGGVIAARLDGPTVAAGTLESVAFPARRTAPADRFHDAASTWAGARVVTAPGDPFRAWACHHPRLAWAPTLRELDGPVVVDLGRLRGGGPVEAVLHQLDVLLLVATADLVDLVATAEWASLGGRAASTDRGLTVDIARIVVVDAPLAPGRATRTMVEYELGDRFAAWLPWAPEAVELLRHGVPPTDRRLRRSPLVPAIEHLVDRLRTWAPTPVTSAAATTFAPQVAARSAQVHA